MPRVRLPAARAPRAGNLSRMNLRALALSALLTVAAAAPAWNATGHMVIAAIAKANMTPATLAEAQRLLLIDATLPGSDDLVGVGPWADDVRNDRRETGPWHYKDLFFRTDGKAAKNKPDAVNAVSKIVEFTAILKDRTKTDSQRAEALRFLVHFVGDIHQPLHAVARETDALPGGDRGGNLFAILPPDGSERGPKNLHSLWDDGAGLLQSYPRDQSRVVAMAEARTLMATLPRSSFPRAGESNPEKWAEESADFARKKVYSLTEGTVPPKDYLERSRTLAAQRLALAGYRLADLLNKALG